MPKRFECYSPEKEENFYYVVDHANKTTVKITKGKGLLWVSCKQTYNYIINLKREVICSSNVARDLRNQLKVIKLLEGV